MEKLRIAVIGRTRAGKSTLINTLIGGDACHVSAVIDTTDKIHKFEVASTNGGSGIYLLDTPGLGGDEVFEAWTRAYLGLPQGRGLEVVDQVPFCRVRREYDCPHAARELFSLDTLPKKAREWHRVEVPAGTKREVVTLPRAFVDTKSLLDRHMSSCQTHRCSHFMPLHVDNAEVQEERPDLILYLVRASMGEVSSKHDALRELGAVFNDRVVPIVTCIDEVTAENAADVVSRSSDKAGMPFMGVSALRGDGMDALRAELTERLMREAELAYHRTVETVKASLAPRNPQDASRRRSGTSLKPRLDGQLEQWIAVLGSPPGQATGGAKSRKRGGGQPRQPSSVMQMRAKIIGRWSLEMVPTRVRVSEKHVVALSGREIVVHHADSGIVSDRWEHPAASVSDFVPGPRNGPWMLVACGKTEHRVMFRVTGGGRIAGNGEKGQPTRFLSPYQREKFDSTFCRSWFLTDIGRDAYKYRINAATITPTGLADPWYSDPYDSISFQDFSLADDGVCVVVERSMRSLQGWSAGSVRALRGENVMRPRLVWEPPAGNGEAVHAGDSAGQVLVDYVDFDGPESWALVGGKCVVAPRSSKNATWMPGGNLVQYRSWREWLFWDWHADVLESVPLPPAPWRVLDQYVFRYLLTDGKREVVVVELKPA